VKQKREEKIAISEASLISVTPYDSVKIIATNNDQKGSCDITSSAVLELPVITTLINNHSNPVTMTTNNCSTNDIQICGSQLTDSTNVNKPPTSSQLNTENNLFYSSRSDCNSHKETVNQYQSSFNQIITLLYHCD
jgi:hypothetical protein